MVVLSEIKKMFWGVTLESGKHYTQTVERSFHISMAALEHQIANDVKSGKGNKGPVSVMIKHDKAEFLLCTLEYGKFYQQPLDLNFTEGEEVTFFLLSNGSGVVHLTGYLIDDSEYQSDMDDPDYSMEVSDSDDSDSDSDTAPALVTPDDSGDSDDDSDDEDELLVSKKRKKGAKEKVVKKKAKVVLSDEEEEDESDDDMDSDDDEEEEEDDEEEEEEEDDDEEEEEEEDDDIDFDNISGFNFLDDEAEESDEDSSEDHKKVVKKLIKDDKDSETPAKVTPGKKKTKNKTGNLDSSNLDKEVLKKLVKNDKDSKSPAKVTPGKKKTEKINGSPAEVESKQTGDEKGESQKKKKKNRKKNKKLEENAAGDASREQQSQTKKPQKMVMSGGLIAEEIKVGHGPEAKSGKMVHVYYTGKLAKGAKQFDSCMSGKPFRFRLGKREVIQGWDTGLLGMKVGGKRKITVPPQQGYGAQRQGPIPPNSTLIFEVELKAVS